MSQKVEFLDNTPSQYCPLHPNFLCKPVHWIISCFMLCFIVFSSTVVTRRCLCTPTGRKTLAGTSDPGRQTDYPGRERQSAPHEPTSQRPVPLQRGSGAGELAIHLRLLTTKTWCRRRGRSVLTEIWKKQNKICDSTSYLSSLGGDLWRHQVLPHNQFYVILIISQFKDIPHDFCFKIWLTRKLFSGRQW